MIIEVRIDKMKGQVVTGGVILRFIRENNKKSHEQCVNCFDELSTPLLRNLRSMTGSVTVTTATPDTPRYTFQQFMDDRAALQTEYYARAIGPAKQKVWEDKVASLKEWELVVIALDGYQKKEHELFQKLAAATEKASELQKLVEQQTTRSARLENEMEHLEKRLTQEHKDNLQKIRDDTNHQLQVEMAKLEDLHRKEIQERELEDTKMEVIQLRKDLAQVEQQQIQNEEIVQLRAELKSKNQEIEDITRERKAESVQQEQVVKELREAGVFSLFSVITIGGLVMKPVHLSN